MTPDFLEVRLHLPPWVATLLVALLVAFTALKVWELTLRFRIRRQERRLEELRKFQAEAATLAGGAITNEKLRDSVGLRVTVHEPVPHHGAPPLPSLVPPSSPTAAVRPPPRKP